MKVKIIILALLFLILDVVSKFFIDNYYTLWQSNTIINNFFAITKVYNSGASWNILSGYQSIIIILTIVILICLLFYQKKFKENTRNLLAFSFLYSGIIGNFIDRLFYGYVIDFLDFKFFGYNFPVFNLADIWIVLGIFFLIIAIFKKEDECGNSSR